MKVIFIDLLNLFTEGVGEGVALILKIGLDFHTYCVWEDVGEGVALILKIGLDFHTYSSMSCDSLKRANNGVKLCKRSSDFSLVS